MLTESEMRIELLKLTYSHGRLAAEAVGRAKELEEYVRPVQEMTVNARETLRLPKYKAGNPA